MLDVGSCAIVTFVLNVLDNCCYWRVEGARDNELIFRICLDLSWKGFGRNSQGLNFKRNRYKEFLIKMFMVTCRLLFRILVLMAKIRAMQKGTMLNSLQTRESAGN